MAARTTPPMKRRSAVRYSEDLATRICERLAAGEAWSRIAVEDDMPPRHALYLWRDRHPPFAWALRLAREAQADAWAEEALAVADAATPQTLAQDKVRISTRLALAARHERTTARSLAKAQSEADPVRRLRVTIRNFTPLERPDGRLITREILEDGSCVDHE